MICFGVVTIILVFNMVLTLILCSISYWSLLSLLGIVVITGKRRPTTLRLSSPFTSILSCLFVIHPQKTVSFLDKILLQTCWCSCYLSHSLGNYTCCRFVYTLSVPSALLFNHFSSSRRARLASWPLCFFSCVKTDVSTICGLFAGSCLYPALIGALATCGLLWLSTLLKILKLLTQFWAFVAISHTVM